MGSSLVGPSLLVAVKAEVRVAIVVFENLMALADEGFVGPTGLASQANMELVVSALLMVVERLGCGWKVCIDETFLGNGDCVE